jgi:hypothetical protein
MSDYSPPLGEFQPPDPADDTDAKWDAWFAEQEKGGYAVISHDEWKERLNEAATDGYAEGRRDEREQLLPMIRWAYSKLHRVEYAQMDDALMLDAMKLELTA